MNMEEVEETTLTTRAQGTRSLPTLKLQKGILRDLRRFDGENFVCNLAFIL